MSLPWEEVKTRADIVDVISGYVPLKSKGGNYTCACPFHHEKTPSLIISPAKQIWHCFGCGAGGDVFGFVSLIENIEKIEALKKLAKTYSVEIPEFKPNPNQTPEQRITIEQETKKQITRFESGQKMLAFGASVYHKILLKLLQNPNSEVTKYCLERGLTIEIIKKFQLGYAPKGNWLLNFLQEHNLDLDLALEVGLFKDLDKK